MKNNLIKALLLITTLTGVLVSCGNKNDDSSLNSNDSASSEEPSSEEQKETINFGKYPQVKVSDESLIASLNETAGTLPTSEDNHSWIDYGYYIEGKVSSYMYYIDIDTNSDNQMDYRGVYMSMYRPHSTDLTSSDTNSIQDDNGYLINTVYWFKYEDITWDVISKDSSKALIVSSSIIDAQDYNYRVDTHKGDQDYQGNTTDEFIRANNYMYSHIRTWLNKSFYQTAFTSLEKEKILTTTVDNSISTTTADSTITVCQDTSDKIFLLSYKDVSSYKLEAKAGSDYSKAQGLVVSNVNGNSSYILRSPTSFQDQNYGVNNYASTINNYINSTKSGVCPACYISL